MKENCRARVPDGSFRGRQCLFRASKDGLCKRHQPEAEAARRQVVDARSRVQEDADRKIRDEAGQLLERLGVNGRVCWTGHRPTDAVVITFADIRKLLERLESADPALPEER